MVKLKIWLRHPECVSYIPKYADISRKFQSRVVAVIQFTFEVSTLVNSVGSVLVSD